MTDAAQIIAHYRARGFRHFALRACVIRHARMLRVLDPKVSAELLERIGRVR